MRAGARAAPVLDVPLDVTSSGLPCPGEPGTVKGKNGNLSGKQVETAMSAR